jgi:hypothetical protein
MAKIGLILYGRWSIIGSMDVNPEPGNNRELAPESSIPINRFFSRYPGENQLFGPGSIFLKKKLFFGPILSASEPSIQLNAS